MRGMAWRSGNEGASVAGRRKGRKLKPGQDALFSSLLPRLRIDPAALPGAKRIFLEVGYGGGEHLLARAAENPDALFIGAEAYLGGIGKLLASIARETRDNIRLFDGDALKLIAALPPTSLDGIFLLYPDPWPKLRHHKRRFVQPQMLAALARILKPGGEFRFATDIEDYANWVLALILRSPDFIWGEVPPVSWHEPWPGYAPTRYETKARAAGRKPFYFSFSKR